MKCHLELAGSCNVTQAMSNWWCWVGAHAQGVAVGVAQCSSGADLVVVWVALAHQVLLEPRLDPKVNCCKSSTPLSKCKCTGLGRPPSTGDKLGISLPWP